jgi:hypothetical protein
MDELVKLVSQKLGVSEAVARQAVEIVVGFLKNKLPGPIASQIDAVMAGKTPDLDLGKGKGILSGLFGRK